MIYKVVFILKRVENEVNTIFLVIYPRFKMNGGILRVMKVVLSCWQIRIYRTESEIKIAVSRKHC